MTVQPRVGRTGAVRWSRLGGLLNLYHRQAA
jgi:hypothetical protein